MKYNIVFPANEGTFIEALVYWVVSLARTACPSTSYQSLKALISDLERSCFFIISVSAIPNHMI